MSDHELKEKLAAIEHQRWSDWMRYLFTKGTLNQDGSFTILKGSVEHWTIQMNTDYEMLSEPEKESDRKEVKRYWKYVCVIQ